MPLTRKLLDMAQTLGLFYYFDFGYSSEAEMLMKILQYCNYSPIGGNILASFFFSKEQINSGGTLK